MSLRARIEQARRREAELQRQIDEVRGAIARDVRGEREARGLTLDDAGRPIRLKRSAVSRLETGRTRLKFFPHLERLAAVIEATPLPAVPALPGTTEAGASAGQA